MKKNKPTPDSPSIAVLRNVSDKYTVMSHKFKNRNIR